MKRVLIVGQAPAQGMGRQPAFTGTPSGRRLERLLRVERGGLLAAVDTVNILRRWPGRHPSGCGDAWPVDVARCAARRVDLGGRGLVLLAGRGVAEAFGVWRAAYFEPLVLSGAHAVVVPHPSGVNHWWNEPSNLRAASAFFWYVLPWGSLESIARFRAYMRRPGAGNI